MLKLRIRVLKCTRRMLKCSKRNLKIYQEKINSNKPVHADSDFIFYDHLLTSYGNITLQSFFSGVLKSLK